MACNAADIPNLEFPRDEIIEVRPFSSDSAYPHPKTHIRLIRSQILPASYHNISKRIHIPGLPQHLLPGSPEDIQMPAPPSGWTTPVPGLGTPAMGSTPGEVSPSTTPKAGTPRTLSPSGLRPPVKPSPLNTFPDGVTTPPQVPLSIGISKKININPSS